MNRFVKIGSERDPDPMSVIVMNDYGWINGGQSKIAIESALALKQRGLDVGFIAGSGPVDDRLMAAGIDCHIAGEHDILSNPKRLQAVAHGIWNGPAARLVRKSIASRPPESTVVHIHGWAKALSPSIGPAVIGSAAAHVYTLHEYFLACPNGGFYDHGRGEICTRKALGFGCLTTGCDARSNAHKAWRVARQVALKAASRMPRDLTDVIYLAPEQVSIMGPYFTPKTRWHHLPNPAGPRPAGRVTAENNSTFLFIGRLSAEKGAEVAAEAAKIAGVPIAFCGDGERADAVRRINPDAVMLGWLKGDELRGWMQRARALVFPSLWYECYPLVVADALREGLPVLVSQNSVAKSSIIDGVDGLHLPAGDVQAWAGAMGKLRSDALVRTLSAGAFDAGRKLLDYDDYTTRLIEIYGNILAKHGAERPRVKDRVL